MRKKIVLLLFILSLLAVSVYASEPKIVDQADLLSFNEEAILEAQACALTEQYDMDVIIVTTTSLDGKSAQRYADDYFDEHGYGMGHSDSGILFLICTDGNYWAISTCGEAIYAMPDDMIDCIFEKIRSDLASGDFFEAFETYLAELDLYFAAYDYEQPFYNDAGVPVYDRQNSRENDINKSFNFGRLGITILINAAIAAVILYFMRRNMNTVRAQKNASTYIQSGSLHQTEHRDIFLYSHTARTAKSDNRGGGHRGGGGGGSVHRSGGRTHGGRSGRF